MSKVSTVKGSIFPSLDTELFSSTRDALHAYSRILGGWVSACREQRKHWWHIGLFPSLEGVTTGPIYANNVYFEIELNFRKSTLLVGTATGESLSIDVHGQALREPAAEIGAFLHSVGITRELTNSAHSIKSENSNTAFADYSPEQANKLSRALSAVTAALVSFRAGVREETSPIQLWPHHFDLAMLWLPGDKISGQDPENAENADKQMNFGFTFGDDSIPEPYFYVTAYPSHEAFSSLDLPEGTNWQSEGFSGAVLTYQTLRDQDDPAAYLIQLWNQLLSVGKLHLANSCT